MYACCTLRLLFLEGTGVLISPWPDQEGNKLQRPNSRFIQHTPHEAQYTSQPVALTSISVRMT